MNRKERKNRQKTLLLMSICILLEIQSIGCGSLFLASVRYLLCHGKVGHLSALHLSTELTRLFSSLPLQILPENSGSQSDLHVLSLGQIYNWNILTNRRIKSLVLQKEEKTGKRKQRKEDSLERARGIERVRCINRNRFGDAVQRLVKPLCQAKEARIPTLLSPPHTYYQ